MPLSGEEKAKAKRCIIARLTPRLEDLGFAKSKASVFHLKHEDGATLVIPFHVPTFDCYYRIWPSWQNNSAQTVAYGPQSEPFECPNSPNGKRYSFRFHRDAESQERCVENIKAWIVEVLLPWFELRSNKDWENPNHVVV